MHNLKELKIWHKAIDLAVANKEFIQFPGVANGSSYELQTQLVISNRFN